MKLKAILLGTVAAVTLSACTPENTEQTKDTPVVKSAVSDIEIHIPYKKFTLDNGLRVIVHEDRKAPIVNVSVWYHVGSKDEPKGKTGFAHLFEHLMFNGSENYNDEYFKPFEDVGATEMNGTTWFDRTNYFQNVPTPALDMALWMESDRMGHLLGAVTKEKLDNQRGVVQNEKRQGDNAPFGKTEYHQLEGMFPLGHPYRHSTIGSMEDLDAASLEDVKMWFKEYYGAANTVIVLAGDIDEATAREKVQKYFGDIPAGPALRKHKQWVPTHSHNTIEQITDKGAPNTRINRAWAISGRTSKDAQLMRVAASVLGGGKNSRLYQALVYKNQLASDVSVSMQPFELTSLFEVQVDIKPGVEASAVEEILNAELQKFLEEGPTAEEVVRSKTKIIAGAVRGLEKIGGFGGKATALAQGELYAGTPSFATDSLRWIAVTTPKAIKDIANKEIGGGYYQLTTVPEKKYSVASEGADRSALPSVGKMPSLAFPEIQETTLSNGMKVMLAKRSTVPVVNMSLQFDAGYAADFGNKLGTASFTLAMLDEGTATKTALEISAEAESLGANINSGSNLDMTSVSLSTLKVTMDQSLALYSDVVRNPKFDQTEMDRLRKRWLVGITQEKANPVQLGLRTLPGLLYGDNHAYSLPYTGSGTEESITSLTREDMMAFHSNWLRPDNATMVVVGDVTMEELKPALEKAFGDWSVPASPLPTKNVAKVAEQSKGRVIIMDKPGSPQSLVLAGHLIPGKGDAEALNVEMANDILGGEFTARVNMNLREDKGWAYGAYTITFDARGERMWLVYAPVQTDKTKDALAELKKEIIEYKTSRPATEAELNRFVTSKINKLPGQYEGGGAVLGSLTSNLRFGRAMDYVTTLPQRYQSMDISSIKAASQAFDPSKLVWLIVGDRAKIEAEVKALGFGDVEIWDTNGNKLN
ncbi:pitrilysin family protein [Temperatibacter marinus]|uniref:Pitrilysin family protein n=1 Tax=Temperatibacter marinus TaxID=1456591 RepID=A0AA52EA42_9PROT|nr:pitrilysin family protein [Temperatibacter marinus]WND01502.1 pitrilysin family protein [Temperatibacter marinus]